MANKKQYLVNLSFTATRRYSITRIFISKTQVGPVSETLNMPRRVPKLGLYLIKLLLQIGVKSSFIHFEYGINLLPIYS